MLNEVDCSLNYSDSMRETHVIAGDCEVLQRLMDDAGCKIRSYELIRGSLGMFFKERLF